MEKKEKGLLGKILTIVGALVVVGGAVVAVIHFWEDIKEKLSCCKKTEIEELEDFVEDEMEDLEEAAEEIQDDMEDFVEFEEF
ncbi:MAG: hypothetical protein IKM59_06395 [Oscillospiraceae bacterium]|nr:hypothetical protein [Oscillospiraceae bacterium]